MDEIKFFELDKLYYGSILENKCILEDIFYLKGGRYYGLNSSTIACRIKDKKPLKEELKRLQLESTIKNSSFNYFETLTKGQVRRVYKVIKTRNKMSDNEVARLNEMSELITDYISDLLGLNIASRPLTDICLSFPKISNILVTGLREFKFRELLQPIVESELYQCYGENCSQIYSCKDGFIDCHISACLKKAGIKKDNIVIKNQFSIKANPNQISVLDDSTNQFVVCYEKSEKVKKINF